MAEVAVEPAPWGGWRWTCDVHGPDEMTAWRLHQDASYAALGHAAHHHPRTASRE